jgi:hypothetical protein
VGVSRSDLSLIAVCAQVLQMFLFLAAAPSRCSARTESPDGWFSPWPVTAATGPSSAKSVVL